MADRAVEINEAGHERLARFDPTTTTADGPQLGPRERELVALLAGGATDQTIAGAMLISVSTVRSHLP